MRKIKKNLWILLLGALILLFIYTCTSCKNENNNLENNWLPITENVNGELLEAEGYRVLKLWSTVYEQGYAHGYLIAPEIVSI